MKITYESLPAAAKEGISEGQKSYIDEFDFYLDEAGIIEAWYADELLMVYYKDHGWRDPFTPFT